MLDTHRTVPHTGHMRIHSNRLTADDVRRAAAVARVSFTRYSEGVSRSHTRYFDVILTGESRRHQNGGPDMAATWDQWGVFLAYLYHADRDMVCGTVKSPVYSGRDDFDYKTDYRFDYEGNMNLTGWWPTDAHGDHTFRFSGVPYQQSCTKCTAVRRWN